MSTNIEKLKKMVEDVEELPSGIFIPRDVAGGEPAPLPTIGAPPEPVPDSQQDSPGKRTPTRRERRRMERAAKNALSRARRQSERMAKRPFDAADHLVDIAKKGSGRKSI